MKVLVALNVVTLVAVVLLGAFVAVNVADTHQQVASISAAMPASGVASSGDVQAAVVAAQSTEKAVADLTAQLAEAQAAVDAMKSQLALVAGAVTSPAPGPSATPDGMIASLMAKLERLQGVVTHIQDDLASLNGLVQTVCSALGRC